MIHQQMYHAIPLASLQFGQNREDREKKKTRCIQYNFRLLCQAHFRILLSEKAPRLSYLVYHTYRLPTKEASAFAPKVPYPYGLFSKQDDINYVKFIDLFIGRAYLGKLLHPSGSHQNKGSRAALFVRWVRLGMPLGFSNKN